MIILDEQIADPAIADKIRRWYSKVTTIQDLGLRGTKDPDIPLRLRHLGCKGATFVTINDPDFWGQMDAEPTLAIVCLDIHGEQKHLVPDCLRLVLVSSLLKTKKKRCGKIILVRGCGTRMSNFWIRTRKSDEPSGPWRC